MPIDIENDDLKTALKKLQAREDNLRKLESVSKLGSWEIDLKTRKSIWSDRSYEIYGIEKGSDVNMNTFFSLLEPGYQEQIEKALHDAITTGEHQSLQCKARNTQGEMLDLLLNAQVLFDENGIPLKAIGTTQDITEYISIKAREKELSTLLEHSSNEIYVITRDTHTYLYVNQGACKSLGYTEKELLGMSVYDTNPELTRDISRKMELLLGDSDHVLNKTKHKRKDGSLYYVQSYIHAITYHGDPAYVIFDTDITQEVELQKEYEQQALMLHHQAHHDALTNLPNRTLFKDRLSQSIVSAKRHKEKFALLFIDLDQFKKINDSLGHHVGDEVLIEAAKRLLSAIREEDTLARLGGDEFTIILKNIQSRDNAAEIAQKIISDMKVPISVANHNLYISSSIGISIYPEDTPNGDNLVKYADTAMYKAKDEGRDNYQFYSRDMTAFAFERVIMESNLRIALKEDQFEVFFQPQFDVKSDKIIGMEALIRWNHPSLGLVPPVKFIPMAEESGLIVEIDRVVMQKAMKHFVSWYNKGLNPGVLSLNLAMKQLSQDDFLSYLTKTMKELEFQANWLELEITEGQVMDNPVLSIEKLKQLNSMGIEIAIDDFGTGYSSLSYLKKFPLDKLKIDRSFVKDIPLDEDDIAITRAIIALGKSLKLKLIAEGVETEAQKDFLIESECDLIQGYLYSKPLPAKSLQALLESKKT